MPAYGRAFSDGQLRSLHRLHPQPEGRRQVTRRCGGRRWAACWRSVSPARSPVPVRSAVIRNRGVLSLCAHANALPFASKTQEPPGFQIELARALARELGVSAPGRVGRQRHPVPHRRLRHRPRHHRRARGAGGAPSRALEALPAQRRRSRRAAGHVGRREVRGPDRSPGGRAIRSLAGMLLGQRGVRLASFGFEDEMIEAVVRGEVDAAAVSPASAGYFNLRHPESPCPVRPRLRHRARAALEPGRSGCGAPTRRCARRSIGAIDRLVADGTVQKIYARYGVEYRPPLGR